MACQVSFKGRLLLAVYKRPRGNYSGGKSGDLHLQTSQKKTADLIHTWSSLSLKHGRFLQYTVTVYSRCLYISLSLSNVSPFPTGHVEIKMLVFMIFWHCPGQVSECLGWSADQPDLQFPSQSYPTLGFHYYFRIFQVAVRFRGKSHHQQCENTWALMQSTKVMTFALLKRQVD